MGYTDGSKRQGEFVNDQLEGVVAYYLNGTDNYSKEFWKNGFKVSDETLDTFPPPSIITENSFDNDLNSKLSATMSRATTTSSAASTTTTTTTPITPATSTTTIVTKESSSPTTTETLLKPSSSIKTTQMTEGRSQPEETTTTAATIGATSQPNLPLLKHSNNILTLNELFNIAAKPARKLLNPSEKN